jgi:hypothetical protein
VLLTGGLCCNMILTGIGLCSNVLLTMYSTIFYSPPASSQLVDLYFVSQLYRYESEQRFRAEAE